MTDDPELLAMATIRDALAPLDEPTRDRVLRWVRDKYGKAVSVVRETPSTWAPPAARADVLPRGQDITQSTDVATVYDAANPSTDADKVLVVGYWLQVVRGDNELDSQTLNAELKNLGYPISNITRTVNTLARSMPRYLMQTKKTGSTQQARKKFRLTREGIKKVEQMMGGAALRLAPADADTGDTDEDDTEA